MRHGRRAGLIELPHRHLTRRGPQDQIAVACAPEIPPGAERCAAARLELRIPPMALCTDNGAMVASLTSLAVSRGATPSSLGLAAQSGAGLEQILWR